MTDILCDFDGRVPEDLSARLEMVVRVQRLNVNYYRIDRTRHGYHLILNVSNKLGAMRTILIQSLLGSDWKRETYNSRRAMQRNIPSFWRERRNVLYKRHYRRISL